MKLLYSFNNGIVFANILKVPGSFYCHLLIECTGYLFLCLMVKLNFVINVSLLLKTVCELKRKKNHFILIFIFNWWLGFFFLIYLDGISNFFFLKFNMCPVDRCVNESRYSTRPLPFCSQIKQRLKSRIVADSPQEKNLFFLYKTVQLHQVLEAFPFLFLLINAFFFNFDLLYCQTKILLDICMWKSLKLLVKKVIRLIYLSAISFSFLFIRPSLPRK